MKGTDHFKRTIQMYLEQRAEEDALFAKSYRNPAKNIDDCVTHILNYVQKSGCNGFTDGEIYGQAIHYYEENEIEVGKPMDCWASSISISGVRSSAEIASSASTIFWCLSPLYRAIANRFMHAFLFTFRRCSVEWFIVRYESRRLLRMDKFFSVSLRSSCLFLKTFTDISPTNISTD